MFFPSLFGPRSHDLLNPPSPPINGRAPGAAKAHQRAALKARNRRRNKRAHGMRGRSR